MKLNLGTPTIVLLNVRKFRQFKTERCKFGSIFWAGLSNTMHNTTSYSVCCVVY